MVIKLAQNRFSRIATVVIVVLLLVPAPAAAQTQRPPSKLHSITDRSVSWPTREEWQRVLLLRDYNTRVVVLGTTLLAERIDIEKVG